VKVVRRIATVADPVNVDRALAGGMKALKGVEED
jgi:hypothetical protein